MGDQCDHSTRISDRELLLVLEGLGSIQNAKICTLVCKRWRVVAREELLEPLRLQATSLSNPCMLNLCISPTTTDDSIVRFFSAISSLCPASLAHVSQLLLKSTSPQQNSTLTGSCLKTAAGLLLNLRHICVWECTGVRNVAVQQINSFPSLEVIDIRNCPLIDDSSFCAPSLQHLTHLHRLFLENVAIGDHTLSLLARLPRLKHLHLRSCHNITVEGFKKLRDLSRLESLDLSGNPTAGLALEDITSIEGLLALVLRQAGVEDCGFKLLGRLPYLQCVCVRGNKGLTDNCLPALWNMGCLVTVNFKECKVTREGLLQMTKLPRFKRVVNYAIEFYNT